MSRRTAAEATTPREGTTDLGGDRKARETRRAAGGGQRSGGAARGWGLGPQGHPPPLARASGDNGDPQRDGEGGSAHAEKQSPGPSQAWAQDWTSGSETHTDFLVISTQKGRLETSP